MYARTTLFEVDTERTSIDAAFKRFTETVLPRLREQPGCLGVIVMQTPEGKGMLVSFWQSSEAAAATLESGFYDAQVRELLMFLRQPPGREQYEVTCYELSDAIVTGRTVFPGQDAQA